MFILILQTLITNFVSFDVEAEEMGEMLTVGGDNKYLIRILIILLIFTWGSITLLLSCWELGSVSKERVEINH